MKNILFTILWVLVVVPTVAQTRLSEEAQISLLTSAPYDEEVFTVYGHAAFRVKDPQQKIDYIFNYGIFDFSKPNFIYRFAKGETDYKLGVTDYMDYITEYQMRGSDVTEQVLNLESDEKERIWQALLLNYEPQNRIYRYNFFFDNCATRLATILEKQVNGKIDYNEAPDPQTFRDLINYCTRNHPWLTFGCDLALGSPTDRVASPHEMMFLPPYLRDAFSKATITRPDGTEKKLVSETSTIEASEADEELETKSGLFTPLVCSILFLGLIVTITYIEWHKKTYFQTVDCLLFFIAGAAGVILFFLSFVSTHPCTWPNWSLIWLQPLDLVAVILFCVKKFNKAAYYYHFINFAALTLMLVGWYFIPQHLNAAFIPLVASIWLRSGYGVYRMKWKIG